MIDPLEVPCAYCGALPEKSVEPDDPTEYDCRWLFCDVCHSDSYTPEEWIIAGINAMDGKLMRKGCSIAYLGGMNWGWAFPPDNEMEMSNYGFASSFEQAVLDAFNHLMKKQEMP